MRVRCIDFDQEKKGDWLTQGKDYYVIDIVFEKARGAFFYRVVSNDGTPVYFEAKIFDIISHNIPDNWIVEITDEFLMLTPKNLTSEFWEKYHDGERRAVSIFEFELQKIIEFDNRSDSEVVDPQVTKNYISESDVFFQNGHLLVSRGQYLLYPKTLFQDSKGIYYYTALGKGTCPVGHPCTSDSKCLGFDCPYGQGN